MEVEKRQDKYCDAVNRGLSDSGTGFSQKGTGGALEWDLFIVEK